MVGAPRLLPSAHIHSERTRTLESNKEACTFRRHQDVDDETRRRVGIRDLLLVQELIVQPSREAKKARPRFRQAFCKNKTNTLYVARTRCRS